MRHVNWFLPVLVGLVVAGCSGYGNDKKGEVSDPVVEGTVAYRERMALPADAEVYLWIMDDTPNVIVAQVVLAETTIVLNGKQVPVPFELRYDPARVAGDHDYGLRAVIKSGGREMFTTREPSAVITKGKPKKLDLTLTRVTE